MNQCLPDLVLGKIFSKVYFRDLLNCVRLFPQFRCLLLSSASNKIKYFYQREKQRRKERYEDKLDYLLSKNYIFSNFGPCCICGRCSANSYIALVQEHKLKSLCSSCLRGEKGFLCVCLS